MHFTYHCWESEQSVDAELWHHTNQRVTILYRLDPDEWDFIPTYHVLFADGFEHDVFEDELAST